MTSNNTVPEKDSSSDVVTTSSTTPHVATGASLSPIRTDFSALLPPFQLQHAIQEWLSADVPTFDVGALAFGLHQHGVAHLYMKSVGVVAGRPFFDTIFSQLDCRCEWETNPSWQEGSYIDPSFYSDHSKIVLATVTGPVARILQGERTALETLSRCSGVATAAHKAVQIVAETAPTWKGWVAGTRKTTPGSFRMVEKYGLLVGGAATHRLDLSQMVMLKDNHINACGGNIRQAVHLAREAAGFSQKIEVECQSLSEAIQAADAGADIVMLDNFAPERLQSDATAFKKQYPHVLVEASGGITLETMHEYLCDSVDIVSQGKLTQGYDCVDFSLKIQERH